MGRATQQGIGISGNSFTWNGRKVRLAGSHTWNTVQGMGPRDEITGLSQLALPKAGRGVMPSTRLWAIETQGMVGQGSKWGSNTPGLIAINNGPFTRQGTLNPGFYRALRRTVREAHRKDIITGIVMFEGSIPDIFPRAWEQHPFNGRGPSWHGAVHTRGPWNKLQRQHIRRTVKVLEPFDNVLLEVGNELMAESTPWFQRWVVSVIKRLTDKPVGVSYARGIRPSKGRQETWMLQTGADWIAPHGSSLPAGVPGWRGPIMADSDHATPLVPNLGYLQSNWKAGNSLWLMDGQRGVMLRNVGNMGPDRAFIEGLGG